MDLRDAANILGVDFEQELDAIADNPNSQRAVKLAIAFRDHPKGGAEKLLDLVHQVGERLGFTVREDLDEVIPNLDWWVEDEPAPTGPVVVSAHL